ncbi:MAG TPA: hypothetical protein VLG92_02255 [Candidatus Saccharimonadia bacterium]|nr:hypothetical protein [Candidatus Saccharimonadia bacterium]
MNSAITAILTDETARTSQAVESLAAGGRTSAAQPWLNVAD